jgi:hypothetical protein
MSKISVARPSPSDVRDVICLLELLGSRRAAA